MSENNEQVEKLLGDFFERHTAGDKEGMNEVLQKIQLMLYSGETDSTPFKDYFNNMYTGRSAINVSGMVSDYPRESIIRELLQNVFGCDYDESDIKVMIEFLDEGQVKLTYNETGFTLSRCSITSPSAEARRARTAKADSDSAPRAFSRT